MRLAELRLIKKVEIDLTHSGPINLIRQIVPDNIDNLRFDLRQLSFQD